MGDGRRCAATLASLTPRPGDNPTRDPSPPGEGMCHGHTEEEPCEQEEARRQTRCPQAKRASDPPPARLHPGSYGQQHRAQRRVVPRRPRLRRRRRVARQRCASRRRDEGRCGNGAKDRKSGTVPIPLGGNDHSFFLESTAPQRFIWSYLPSDPLTKVMDTPPSR